MGLDITSYSNLKKGKETEDSIYIGKGPSHVARHDYVEGWYEPTTFTEGHCFRAGSYGGYNQFQLGALCNLKYQKLNINLNLYNLFGVIPNFGKSFGFNLKIQWQIN